MDWPHLLTFAVMAIVIEVSPGPNFLLIAKTVPTAGRAAALSNIVGFACAFYVHGALSIFGFSVVLATSANLFFAVKMAGAIYLCYLGIQALHEAMDARARARSRLFTTPVDIVLEGTSEPPLVNQSIRRGMTEGFITNILNPKITLFYLAAFPQFITAGKDSALSSFLLVTIHVIVNAFWFTLVAIVLERLLVAARSERFVGLLKLFSGVALIGFGATFAANATATPL